MAGRPAAIALFGGSFNPPHLGHLGVCAHVLGVHPGELWLLPTFVHPFGKQLAPFDDRVAMCELLLADLDDPEHRARVVTIEREVPGHSGRTVDTLRHLRELDPEGAFRLVLGADLYEERHQWKDFDEVERLAPPLWIPRRGFDDANEALGLTPFLGDVRSVEIRARLAAGESLEGLVTEPVARYISQHALYRA
ncbi:MAG: nicotinate-nicotinamide nucleotide adenylyltransferase [Deltaproteobacteria bacterium]|nr:nicotinate-nicotinamide nucleotide adenylyltransferase [Deltaproteobacteria bacterium]